MSTRILALVGDCYGAQGGIARYNQDLFEALAESGAEILIVPRLGDAAGLALPALIQQHAPVFGRLMFSLASLSAAWRHRPVNVVFCGHVFMAPLAWLLSRLFGARYWLQAHGIDILSLRRGLVRRAIEAADQVTTVSRATRKSLLEQADIAPERVRVLPNTIRGMFAPGPPSEALRGRLQLGPSGGQRALQGPRADLRHPSSPAGRIPGPCPSGGGRRRRSKPPRDARS
jgi:phosphatidylinositol alpha-1,6-mannosyltransferase